MKWACEKCAKKRFSDLHPYTVKLLEIYSLQQAGYPFEKNDLTVSEWFDLAKVKQVYNSALNPFQMASKQ